MDTTEAGVGRNLGFTVLSMVFRPCVLNRWISHCSKWNSEVKRKHKIANLPGVLLRKRWPIPNSKGQPGSTRLHEKGGFICSVALLQTVSKVLTQIFPYTLTLGPKPQERSSSTVRKIVFHWVIIPTDYDHRGEGLVESRYEEKYGPSSNLSFEGSCAMTQTLAREES